MGRSLSFLIKDMYFYDGAYFLNTGKRYDNEADESLQNSFLSGALRRMVKLLISKN